MTLYRKNNNISDSGKGNLLLMSKKSITDTRFCLNIGRVNPVPDGHCQGRRPTRRF